MLASIVIASCMIAFQQCAACQRCMQATHATTHADHTVSERDGYALAQQVADCAANPNKRKSQNRLAP